MNAVSILLAVAFLGGNVLPGFAFQPGKTAVQPTVQLRVSANGDVIKEGNAVRVKPGEVVKLKVEVIHADGTVSDVTNDSKSRYFPESPSQLSIETGGRVVVLDKAREGGVKGVGIIYGRPGDPEIGAASVVFEVESRQPANKLFAVAATRTALGVGESARLTVTKEMPDGKQQDVTTDPRIQYFTTSESALILEPGGKVTCIGTHGQPSDSASVTVTDGVLSGTVAFDLHMQGPAPGLKIDVSKTSLGEGESIRFSVRSLKDGAVPTSRAAGTTYVVFGGKGVPETGLLTIDDSNGTIVATKSLGRYNRRSAIIFARNGDLFGWIELKITHASAKS